MSKRDVVEELHRGARRNFIRRKTLMRGINDTIQADLVEMIPYARQNRNFKYILTAINIFSKMAYARPLKNKAGETVARALKSIFDSLGYRVRNLHVDMGKEFYNEAVTRTLSAYNINRYSTFSTKKAAICERFNRTLKQQMWKEFSHNGNYKWIEILDKLIDKYNSSYHRTIKTKPKNVTLANQQHLLDTVYNYRYNIGFNQIDANATAPTSTITTTSITPKFRVGDSVRLSKYKHVFEKGYTPNWTTEIFKIRKVQYNTFPVTYLLSDYLGHEIRGSVYQGELSLAKYPNIYLIEKIIRKRGDQVFVKWLGFDSSHNSWVSKTELL